MGVWSYTFCTYHIRFRFLCTLPVITTDIVAISWYHFGKSHIHGEITLDIFILRHAISYKVFDAVRKFWSTQFDQLIVRWRYGNVNAKSASICALSAWRHSKNVLKSTMGELYQWYYEMDSTVRNVRVCAQLTLMYIADVMPSALWPSPQLFSTSFRVSAEEAQVCTAQGLHAMPALEMRECELWWQEKQDFCLS